MDCIDRYLITATKLSKQYIEPDVASMTIVNYPEWLNGRAAGLAQAGNEFLESLGASLRSPVLAEGT